VLIGSLLLGSAPAPALAAPSWKLPFKADHCTSAGVRQFSSQLMNISGDWKTACENMGATINGHTFSRPARCVANAGMWGEFEVPDPSCLPHWTEFKKDACRGVGVRQYSAQLMDIPPGVDWHAACQAMPAVVQGQQFARPTRCVNNLAMWGEFDVPDDECRPHWGPFQKADECKDGVWKYSAQLMDIPPGADWYTACLAMPAVVEGQRFDRPTRCVNNLGMWGEFEVGCVAVVSGPIYGGSARRVPLDRPKRLGPCGTRTPDGQMKSFSFPVYCGVLRHYDAPAEGCTREEALALARKLVGYGCYIP
jgi:hypothetical protein